MFPFARNLRSIQIEFCRLSLALVSFLCVFVYFFQLVFAFYFHHGIVISHILDLTVFIFISISILWTECNVNKCVIKTTSDVSYRFGAIHEFAKRHFSSAFLVYKVCVFFSLSFDLVGTETLRLEAPHQLGFSLSFVMFVVLVGKCIMFYMQNLKAHNVCLSFSDSDSTLRFFFWAESLWIISNRNQ